MESLIGLVNRIQRACTVLGDYGGGDAALPTLWEALPSVVVVGGQVLSLSLSLSLYVYICTFICTWICLCMSLASLILGVFSSECTGFGLVLSLSLSRPSMYVCMRLGVLWFADLWYVLDGSVEFGEVVGAGEHSRAWFSSQGIWYGSYFFLKWFWIRCLFGWWEIGWKEKKQKRKGKWLTFRFNVPVCFQRMVLIATQETKLN